LASYSFSLCFLEFCKIVM